MSTGEQLVVSAVTPAPTDEELVAIVAALELAWPRPVVVEAVRRRGMKPVICSQPTRAKRRRIDRRLYRQRYQVECFFHNLKRFRAVATRYDKTAQNYLAFVHVACLRLWLD